MIGVTVESRDVPTLLEEVYRRLLKYDPEIVEIIQFGSSVYAPQHAKDIDLLVITRRAKKYSGYMDAANREDMPFNVDIIISEVNKPINKSLLKVMVPKAFSMVSSEERDIGGEGALATSMPNKSRIDSVSPKLLPNSIYLLAT